MVENKKEWARKGCLILSNGWCDSTAQKRLSTLWMVWFHGSKEIVNFLVKSL